MSNHLPIPIEKNGQIYKITCLTSNKNYIGQTHAYYSCLDGARRKYGFLVRFKRHLYEAKTYFNHSAKLDNAIRLYGEENFKVELIFECHPKFLNHFEKLFISEYDSKNNGYNTVDGGFSFEPTPEIVEKRARTLTKVNIEKRQKFIRENESRIEKAIIGLISNAATEHVFLDIFLNNPNEIKRFRYHQSYEPIEEPFDRAYEDIIMFIDSEKLYIQHELQNHIPLDKLELYEFNRDDIYQMQKTLKHSNNLCKTIEKRIEKFKNIQFTKISIRLKIDKGIHLIDVNFITDQKYTKKSTQFGGEKINFLYAYQKSLEFSKRLISDDKIEIRGDIQNIVRLLNIN